MAFLRCLSLFLPLGTTVFASDQFRSNCASFPDKVDLPNVRVNFASYVPGGTNLTLVGNPASCDEPWQLVITDTCRVSMAVSTSNQSEITLEAWFPRNYTGRFLSSGNGGLGGCIQHYDLAYGSFLGFATVGANNGHNGTSGEPFYQHPEVIEDFVYRSLHTGVVVGKQLTKLFYPEGFKKSYYIGCSTGGRQGFKAVQEFPEEFDGVLAGAPAFNFINLLSWSAWFLTITGPPGADTFLSPAEWKIVHQEILRQCDGLDGAVDGIIEDPDLCHPIIETLICKPGENEDTCLTGIQAHTVREILSPYYGENGTLLYPRMQPGSEIEGATTLYSGTPFPYSTDWYRYVVYNDPNWDPATFNVHDASVALAQNPFNVQTWESNLTAFRDAGGKVLTYHGLEDHLISSENSKLYYARVAETMKLPPSELDQFYRLFPISGMAHCDEGEGASAIGNELNTFTGTDPEDNVLMAVVKWVEEGVAPETVRGAKLVDGPGSAIEYRRKHCRYPRRNVFKGPGHYTDENAWHCV